VWRAAEQYSGHYGTIIKLLILTGLRRGECAAIQSSWVQADTLTIPKEAVKNGRELVLPLSPMTAALLQQALEEARSLKTNDPLLFPAANYPNQPFSGFSQSKKNLDKLLTISKFTHHDLRRTYRTNLGRLKVAPHISERLVNHASAQNEMEQIYDQYTYWDEKVEAVQKYNDWLSSLLGR
jgi:integrase